MGPVQGQRAVREAVRIPDRRLFPAAQVGRLRRPQARLPEPRGPSREGEAAPEGAHPGRPRAPALRGRPPAEPGADPRRGPGHGRPDLAHGHPGPVPRHPGRPRPARHHPPDPGGRVPHRRRHRRRGHHRPAARHAPRVPGQEGEVRELRPGAAEDGQAQVGDARPRPLHSPGQHRAARRDRAGPVHGRGGRRPVPVRVHLPPAGVPADRGGPLRYLLPPGPRRGAPPGHDPDPGHRRREEPASAQHRDGSPTRRWA